MSYSLVFTLLCAGSLAAQPFTRSVQGVVTDQHSRPLDHAVVQIENEWTLAIRSYDTRADGEYHFAELSRDRDYRLTAEYDGLRSRERTLSKFNSRDDPTLNLKIRLGQ